MNRTEACFTSFRYLKRGVSDTGNVANDVEVEQVSGFYHAQPVKHGQWIEWCKENK